MDSYNCGCYHVGAWARSKGRYTDTMKNNATPEQLILFAEWVFRTYKKD